MCIREPLNAFDPQKQLKSSQSKDEGFMFGRFSKFTTYAFRGRGGSKSVAPMTAGFPSIKFGNMLLHAHVARVNSFAGTAGSKFSGMDPKEHAVNLHSIPSDFTLSLGESIFDRYNHELIALFDEENTKEKTEYEKSKKSGGDNGKERKGRRYAQGITAKMPKGSVGHAINYWLSKVVHVVGDFAAGDIGEFYERNEELLRAELTIENALRFAILETEWFKYQSETLVRLTGGLLSAHARKTLIMWGGELQK